MDLWNFLHNLPVNLWPIVLIIAIGESASASYGYSKRDQHIWPQNFKACGGKRQSPIALSSPKSIGLPLPALEMNGYHDYLSGPIKLKNTGRSVTLNINKNLSRKKLPYIFGAMLDANERYELESLHFHWGMKNNRGSEHILNGVRYPMEMHIIHRNMKYPNNVEAMEHEDGLTVLGIFFQLQEENNERLGPIVNSLPSIRWLDLEQSMNVSFVLASLMPKDLGIYYTYKGSLTSPPCSEVVTWIVFPTPVSISFRQMERFRMLSNGEDVLADNYRHLQEIGNRKIYVRRLGASFASDPDMIDLNITQLKWHWE